MALAACGGGEAGAEVAGTFAPGGGLSPTGVWVVESQRREAADSAGFRVADLTPGPVSIRLLSGADTAGVLDVSGLPPGAKVRLRELRVDRDSRFAFPRSIELEGADVVTINGLRMAPDGRIPRKVDERGAMLAWSSDIGAMLVRPADTRLPDLRVVVGAVTEFVGTDGGAADRTMLQPGDSVRVEGRADDGYVLATRITVPTRIVSLRSDSSNDGSAAEDEDDSEEGGEDGGSTTSSSAPARAAPVPVVRPGGGGGNDGPGRGNGRERGKGGGRGKGKGKG